jgi:hypothetical protein
MTRLICSPSKTEANFVGLLMKQVEVISFDRALLLQPATSKARQYRSAILRSLKSSS